MQNEIPKAFWKDLCQDADYPMACVGIDNKFIWVNNAFEKLVGYSCAELENQSWVSITQQKDVGGDLASVQAVIDGKIKEYSLSKEYIHKRGHFISVELIVRRFPPSTIEPLLCFRVETPIAKPTKTDLQTLRDELKLVTTELKERIESKENINITNNNEGIMGDKWRDGNKAGRDNSTNSQGAIKIMAGALVVIVMVVSWMFYYVSTVINGTDPVPPPTISQDIGE